MQVGVVAVVRDGDTVAALVQVLTVQRLTDIADKLAVLAVSAAREERGFT